MKLSVIALLLYSAATFAADYTCYRTGTKDLLMFVDLTNGQAKMHLAFEDYVGSYSSQRSQCPSRVCGYIWFRGQVAGPNRPSRKEWETDDFVLYGPEGHGSLSGSVYFHRQSSQRVDVQCELESN